MNRRRRLLPYHAHACPRGKCRGCDRQEKHETQRRWDKAVAALWNNPDWKFGR